MLLLFDKIPIAKYWNAYDDVKKNEPTISNQTEAPYLKPKLIVSPLPGWWPGVDQDPLPSRDHESDDDDVVLSMEKNYYNKLNWGVQNLFSEAFKANTSDLLSVLIEHLMRRLHNHLY